MSESESEAHLLPEGLVTSGEPRLTKLTLSRCFFPYNSPAYGNLVHLDLRDLAPSCPPSFTQLNEMFASMNSLRTLKLADVFSHVIDPLRSRVYAPASFNLPQTLESLYWEEHVAVFLDITLYFIIAPTTTVEFAIPFDFQNTLSAAKFSSAIATIVSRIWDGSPHPPETMQIRTIDKGGYTDSLVAAVRHRKVQLTCACTDDWADVAPYDLMIKWHAVAPVKVTATTVCGVRADGLHDLALGIDDENMKSLGPAVLPLAPNVRKLRIFESALLSALPRLRENICVVRESVAPVSPASPARLLLPHLESICIINDVGNLNAGDIGRVCEYLRMRKELGHGVEELHIPSRYSQNEEIMAQLREELYDTAIRCRDVHPLPFTSTSVFGVRLDEVEDLSLTFERIISTPSTLHKDILLLALNPAHLSHFPNLQSICINDHPFFSARKTGMHQHAPCGGFQKLCEYLAVRKEIMGCMVEDVHILQTGFDQSTSEK
ncbi:hypothetical protein OF83DRAFT_1179289 [Amylostereum chailletii]|nr:hypothetical protein OF83DRAFT_1179289 [Amylostereum chailletii]